MNPIIFALVLSLCGLALSNAFAVGGVPEINHNCATLLGCFSGDTPGYPITIDGSAGGSYRVSSDLIVPDASTDGIRISAPSVSIDLGGFEILRSGCESATIDCTPASGNGYGVVALNNQMYGVLLHHGNITGMGIGVWLGGPNSEVAKVRVRWNRGGGIEVGESSAVRDSIAYANGGGNARGGIVAGKGSILSGNLSRGNALEGFSVGDSSSLQGNLASGNGNSGLLATQGTLFRDNVSYQNFRGFQAGLGSIIRANSAYDNSEIGFTVASAAIISNNTSFDNISFGIASSDYSIITDNTAHSNSLGGIAAGAGSLLQGNAVRNNTGAGLTLAPDVPYRRNVMTGNAGGDVISGSNLGNNFCNTGICL